MSESPEEQDSESRGTAQCERSNRAVLALIAGKKSIDALSRQFGVSTATDETWRTAALEGITSAMGRGSEPSQNERALERENESLKEALTDTSIQLALIK